MSASKSNLIAGALIIAIIIAVFSILRQLGGGEAPMDVIDYGGFGGYAAAKVYEHLGEGKRVAVILFDDSAAAVYGMDQYAFVESLKQRGYRIAGIETVSAGTLLRDPTTAETGVLPMGTYLQVAASHAGVDAILSFAGPPVPVPDPPPARVEDTPPLIIILNLAEAASWALLESGFADMAIMERRTAQGMPAPSAGTERDRYEAMFQAVTR